MVINVIVSCFLIIIIAFVLYETVNYTIYSRFESDLTSNAKSIVSIMENTTIPSNSKVIYFNQVNLPGYLILILNSSGQIIEESGKISVTSNFLDKLSNVAQKYHSAYFFKEHINKDNLLMLSIPIYENKVLDGFVVIGNSTNIIDNSLSVLSVYLIFGSIIFVFLIFIVNYYFVEKVIESIDEITSQIISITGFKLNQRLMSTGFDQEIVALAEEFNKLFDRLEDTFQRESAFINDVAHEIKTPLAIINGEGEMALSKGDEKRDYVKAIKSIVIETKRIEKVLNDVLSLARTKYLNKGIENVQFDLYPVIFDIAGDVNVLSNAKNISFKFSPRGKNFYVFGNRDSIRKAISNVAINAVKYTKTGSINLYLYKKSSKIYIIVEDTGIGIKKDDLYKIFNRFYRSKNSNKFKGAGLGLAISKSIIESFGGNISVDSTVGKGSKFTITFTESKKT